MAERSTQARAFAPGNISGVFKIIPHDDPTRMHSLGMGFTVSEGVAVGVSRALETSVVFNGEAIDFPTVVAVAEFLTDVPVTVDIQSVLPLSAGFGLSGASALATAYAIDVLLDLGRGREELAMAAHVCEVQNLTGLGDVCAQFHGGCLVKLVEGQPLKADRLAVEEQPVYYRYFSPISTREVLSDPLRREQINSAADRALQELARLAAEDSVEFADCISASRGFAEDSGLLQDAAVRQIIAQIEADGGAASMIMLGNAVFSLEDFDGAKQTTLSMGAARPLDPLEI